MVERPIAESMEYRPPTQSQNPNMFCGSIPNAATSRAFVDTATKCRATARSSPSRASSQARAARAFVRVSRVVKVLEDTMTSVSAGSRSRVASTRSVGSMFDTNRNVMSRRAYQRRASYAITGPRSEPPMPMLMTLRIGRPVCPRHAPHTRGEVRHPVEHGVHVGDDVPAVEHDRCPAGRPQRHVEHGALLGRVDLVAAEHGLDPLAQAGRRGERAQQPQGLVHDPVLGVVEAEARGLGDHALAAPGIRREEVAEVPGRDQRVVGGERVPSLPGGFAGRRHRPPPCRRGYAGGAPKTASGTSALTMYWPASTISEILRSTHRLERRYASSRDRRYVSLTCATIARTASWAAL